MGISNDYRIDALLRGADTRWNSTLASGTPTEITYGFMEVLPSYYASISFESPGGAGPLSDAGTFSALDSARRDLVRNEFQIVSDTIPGLAFLEVSDASAATILVGAGIWPSTSGDAQGYAPDGSDTSGNLDAAGDIWFRTDSVKYDISRTYEGLPMGQNQFADMALHEIGHALGLKHPGNYAIGAGSGTGSNAPPYLPASEDDSSNTVMSYNGDYAGPNLRSYDVLALQFLYGSEAPANDLWLLAGGGDGDDSIQGSTLNELIFASKGSDRIDAATGTDTVVYSGERSDFTIVQAPQDAQNGIASADHSVTDTTGAKGGTDSLVAVERLQFTDTNVGLDVDGIGGKAYRIYKAAFDRTPDSAGLGYWIAQMDQGMDLIEVSARFIDSAEFRSLYGTNPSNGVFLTNVYRNVLGRDPDSEGYAWWTDQLANNPEKTWQKVLADFSESTENQANVIGLIGNGFEYSLWAA